MKRRYTIIFAIMLLMGWVGCQFNGAEISGIKLHAAIDSYIHNNHADGSAICIDKDYTGAERHQVTFAGPFDCDTVNRIVWD